VPTTLDRLFLTLFSDSDPITSDPEKLLQTTIPRMLYLITQAAPFLQEDKPHQTVEHLVKFVEDNSLIPV
jgi:hypothetical protein